MNYQSLIGFLKRMRDLGFALCLNGLVHLSNGFRLCYIPQTFNVSLCEIPSLKYIWSMDCSSFPMLLLHPFLCCSFSEF